MNSFLGDNFDAKIYSKRRRHLAAQLKQKGGGVALIPTSPETQRNRDNVYPYRADSYFYYLTGFTEPDSWLVLTDTGHTTLFCRSKDPAQEVWTGYRLGPDAAPEVLALEAAYPVEELDEIIPELLANQPAVWYPFATHTGLETQVDEWLQSLRGRVRSGILPPQAIFDLCSPLDEMRLIKDTHELSLMRQAGKISALGHFRAMQKCAKMIHAEIDLREYHLEAELLHEFCRHGAQDVSFNAIVAAGANACILHYRAGYAPIKAGELVLIDAGCEYLSYAGDISRTFPASGQFTPIQRELYTLVLSAQQAACHAVKPGNTIKDVHFAAVETLAQGMLDLGLLDKDKHGSLEDVITNQDYRRFYMHNTSHWLGLDVHDCGQYVDFSAPPQITQKPETGESQREFPPRKLQEGMVLTLEPGIYIPAVNDVPECFHHIGIRIEDNALVTLTGSELLTRDVPVYPGEIEALMREALNTPI